MITFEIPGREPLQIEHVVLDYNGTIAVDGKLISGVAEKIKKLRERVSVYVLTADTYGTVEKQCGPLGVTVKKFPREGAAVCKEEIVKNLPGGAACLGNGFNDILMFDAAALSIAVVEGEGMCAALLAHADVAVTSIAAGLDLLLSGDRLRATLRS